MCHGHDQKVGTRGGAAHIRPEASRRPTGTGVLLGSFVPQGKKVKGPLLAPHHKRLYFILLRLIKSKDLMS